MMSVLILFSLSRFYFKQILDGVEMHVLLLRVYRISLVFGFHFWSARLLFFHIAG